MTVHRHIDGHRLIDGGACGGSCALHERYEAARAVRKVLGLIRLNTLYCQKGARAPSDTLISKQRATCTHTLTKANYMHESTCAIVQPRYCFGVARSAVRTRAPSQGNTIKHFPAACSASGGWAVAGQSAPGERALRSLGHRAGMPGSQLLSCARKSMQSDPTQRSYWTASA